MGRGIYCCPQLFFISFARPFSLYCEESLHIQGVPGECARLRDNVPYAKVHQYNPKHLYPKLNGYGDNG